MMTGSGANCQLRTLIEVLAPFSTDWLSGGRSATSSCAKLSIWQAVFSLR
jgi:hypothetical protein